MFTLNGRKVDRAYTNQLKGWVDKSENEFTPEEFRRARRATAFLEAKVQGPNSLAPRVTIGSVINLAAVLLVLVLLLNAGRGSSLLEELRDFGTPGEVFLGTLIFTGAYPLTFLCFAVVSVGWAKWIRVIGAILGFIALLWVFITGMVLIVSAPGTIGGFAAFIYIGLIVWFIVLLARGGRN